MQVLNSDSAEDKIYYNNFIYSYKTEVTRKNSIKILKYYMNFLSVSTLRELVEDKPQKIIESDIKAYLVYLRNEKKISHNAAALYLSVIKKFYVVNTDYQFKWNLINMYLGNDDTDDSEEQQQEQIQQEQEDRPYTRDEIQKMFNAAQDLRVKMVISLMSSSGLRNGAVNILKIKDLEKIEKYNIYKITAYRTSKKFRYHTFTTPEAAALIDSYLEYRKKHGEVLKGYSPLLREQFSTKDRLKANNPRHLTPRGIRTMINDVLIKYSGLRKKLNFDHENKRKQGRNPTKLTHGFRKFFNTECAKAGVYPDFIELMLGHHLPGVRSHYMKPDINTLLEGTKEVKGYVAAIDYLTINDENRLQKKVQELNEKNQESEYIIKGKLQEVLENNQEKDQVIKIMKSKIESLDANNKQTIDAIATMGEALYKMAKQLEKVENERKSLSKKEKEQQNK